MTRHLDWEGCFNARDLGGLPTVTGAVTQFGRVIRSDAPNDLTGRGWRQLWEYGVRTIIDLRNDDEIVPDATPRQHDLLTLRMPIDGVEDREFWDEWGTGAQFGTPLYFRPHLERFPHLTVEVVAAIADAPSGAVLFHCSRGRDRTGLISMLLLSLAGVPPEAIADDYASSEHRLASLFSHRGEADQGLGITAFLSERGTTPYHALLGALRSLDVDAHLRRSGLTHGHLMRVRSRLLDP